MPDDKIETSRPDGDLTGDKPVVAQESPEGSTEPKKEEVKPDDATNFQHALQRARESEKIAKGQLEEAEKALGKYKNAEDERKRENMTETEKWRTAATEEGEKRARLELKLVIGDSVKGYEVPQTLLDALIRVPWEIIPAVKAEIDTTNEKTSWDDVIASVEKHLPDYLNPFKVGETNPSEESSLDEKVDSERSLGDDAVVRGHVYTKDEIDQIRLDPKEWEKHREKILAQLQTQGGTLQ